MELLARNELPPDPARLAAWRAVATHTHNLRSRQVPPARAEANLVAWCRRHGVQAAGIGSPWEPVSAASYGRYEGPDRDLYYSGRLDPRTLRDEPSVRALFDRLNAAAGGATRFYLDNETPKSRYGHLWWFGYHYDYPAWHDYSQDRPIQYYEGDAEVELNALTGAPHRRRPYLEIVATQRAAGALGVWAHPTSWWTDAQGGFVTNIAAELPLHLLADGTVDGMAVMGYDACHRGYQGLWCHLLDHGYRVPGFAETDTCFDRANLLDDARALVNFFPLAADAGLPQIQAAARRGNGYMGTGGLLTVSVDGVGMGGAVRTARGRVHRATVWAWPRPGQEAFARLEVLGRGGAVRVAVDGFRGGALELAWHGDGRADYLLARAFGAGEDPAAPQKRIRDFLLSNPVYLHAAGGPPPPVTTALTLTVRADSPWAGGVAWLETAGGEPLEAWGLTGGPHRQRVPANARLRLQRAGRADRVLYPAMESRAVQAHLRYLHDGEFRRDCAGLAPGAVPPECFRLAQMAAALATNEVCV